MIDIPHEEQYRGYTIRVDYDEQRESPREWDNLGTMYCRHPRYSLGDKGGEWLGSQYSSLGALISDISHYENDDIIALQLWLYDHSGLTMNTVGFHCIWDTSLVGVIYVTRKDALRSFGRTRMSEKLRQKIEDVLRLEVKTYDHYLRGDVYFFAIFKGDERMWVDCCGGFYSIKDTIEEAKSIIDDKEKG